LVYKLIEIVGKSDKSFAEAAKNAVEVASKTVKAIRWVDVVSLGMQVGDDLSIEYEAKTKIAFEIREEYAKK
jgi:flavin-binding protein dodecin